jgi:four helix bundle protein
METKVMPFNFFRFEDLRIYHKSLDYIKWVYAAVADFPQNDRDELGRNFVKAATNIAGYIAEGSGRNKSQFIYYLKMAKSSIRECVVLSTIAHQNGLLSIEKEDESRNFLIEISKMVGALIASLQRSRRPDEEDESEPDTDPVSGTIDPNIY